jgi:hypothetical protein
MTAIINNKKGLFLITIVFAMIVMLFAVSRESLWIDEGCSAVKAMAPSWHGFALRMSLERGSDIQMPCYMFLLWAWEKLAGSSEWALRSMNLLFLAVAWGIIVLRLRACVTVRCFFVLLSCCSPFLWEYLNEARPYLLEFLGATVMLTGLYNLSLSRQDGNCSEEYLVADVALAVTGMLLLIATSLSTIFYLGIFGLVLLGELFRRRNDKGLWNDRRLWILLIGGGICLALLGLYYFWTLRLGARASAVGRTNIQSSIFCFYEIFGFLGLGPGRGMLRDNPLANLPHYAPLLLLQAGVMIGWIVTLLSSFRSKSCPSPSLKPLGVLTPLVLAALMASLMILMLGVVTHFRVLGRHLMPAFPVMLLLASVALDVALQKRGRLLMVWTAALVLVNFVSCFELRFAERHAKDNYRDAAAIAHGVLKNGGVVWWSADKSTAEYYGVIPYQLSEKCDPGILTQNRVSFLMNCTPNSLARLPFPGLVIVSKPDIYDACGTVQRWLSDNHYSIQQRFTSFQIWENSRR